MRTRPTSGEAKLSTFTLHIELPHSGPKTLSCWDPQNADVRNDCGVLFGIKDCNGLKIASPGGGCRMSPVSHGLQVPGARLEQVGKSEAGYMLLHFLRGPRCGGQFWGQWQLQDGYSQWSQLCVVGFLPGVTCTRTFPPASVLCSGLSVLPYMMLLEQSRSRIFAISGNPLHCNLLFPSPGVPELFATNVWSLSRPK